MYGFVPTLPLIVPDLPAAARQVEPEFAEVGHIRPVRLV